MRKLLFTTFVILLSIFNSSCSSQRPHGLRVAATPVPHAEMLEAIKTDLEDQGIELVIVVTDDYQIPNRSLASGEVDANFFQHLPFLQAQIQQFHYPIMNFGSVEIEPLGLYSRKIQDTSELEMGAKIAIPSDPTNEARALQLLAADGIIALDTPSNTHVTVINIVDNPKKIQFIEIEGPMLARSLDEVDAAIINTNYALQAKMSPLKDAIILEDRRSPYVNILAIRRGDENREDLKALKKALTSDKMRKFIFDKYQGAIAPTF